MRGNNDSSAKHRRDTAAIRRWIRGGWAARRWAARRLTLNYPRTGRSGFLRWLPSWRQVILTALFFVGTLTGFTGYLYWQTDIPEDLNEFATQQDNVYYWADGTEMARTGPVNRQEVALGKVPRQVQWAVLAAENADFYSDNGISPTGLVRAVSRMATGGDTQGGSTITQQYVKNAYLNQRQTFSRKLTEMFIAMKLDNRMSKQEILQGYLNTSWFGRGTYGIQRAAYAYYRKDVSELNASEGAFLASLLQGAGLYDPALSARNHRRAERRWSWVLDRMVDIGKLSKAERAGYTTFPEPQAPPKDQGLSGQTGYLVETAKAYVKSHSDVTDADLDLGGYQIRTTFQKPKVDQLAKAVEKERRGLDPERRKADRDVRIGAASVASDGGIAALYGGPDYIKQGFNDANASNVPAGTAFMPFVYAAGLRDGVQRERNGARSTITPDTEYDGDDKVAIHTPEGPYWDRGGKIVRGENDGGRSWGRISLSDALAQSVNGPVMQLGMDVGLDRVRRASTDAGLLPGSFGTTRLVPALSLGTATPSAIRMAGAYETFARGGVRRDPYSVTRITRNGDKVDLAEETAKRVFSAEVAGAVDDSLKESVRTGPAGIAAAAGSDTAAKPGIAQDGTSAWFVGYTDTLATAVSVSRLDPKTQELQPLDGLGGSGTSRPGGSAPGDIWAEYMKAVAP